MKEELVNKELTAAQDAIQQFERLQSKRKAMMKTALTTAELLETVPRSVLLASLTNNLPVGVSLLRLNLIQKKPKQTTTVAATSKYQKAQANTAAAPQANISEEKLLETHIDIEGVASSDRQVATYIECLNASNLLASVALVESKEHKVDDMVFRRFKLAAMLRKNVQLSKQDIETIRARGENATRVF
jgi:Tfp pilus assembly protein PilN